jgi:hypothetical protein
MIARMSLFLRTLAVLAAFGASLAHAAPPSIVGSWELTYVAPTALMNTIPTGVSNVKLHFTEDGHLLSLQPDETSVARAQTVTYTFDGKQLHIQSRDMQVAFPDADTMVITQKFESQRTFKRLASFEQRLEPRSLQLVGAPSDAARVTYDARDYSALPLPERVRGIWEVIAWQNVPQAQVPPYGFLNDLYTVTADQVTVARRQPPAQDAVPFQLADGLLVTSGIGLGGPPGSKVEWTPTFDDWGHLVLDGKYCRVVLKLVTKDTSATPTVPLQVVVMRTRK